MLDKIFEKMFPKRDAGSDTCFLINSDLTVNIDEVKKIKEFLVLKDTKQNEAYHSEGNAWNHTMLVCKEMRDMLMSCAYGDFSEMNQKILMLAALCHDLGKGNSTYWSEEENTWKCKSHGLAGEKITRNILFNLPVEMREEVCWLVRWHMNFHHLLDKGFEGAQSGIKKLMNGNSSLNKLLLLNLCDSLGSIGKDYSRDMCFRKAGRIEQLLKQMHVYDTDWTIKVENPDEEKYRMYVLIGLPGSGKDTYIREALNPDWIGDSAMTKECIKYPVICRDDIREELEDGKVVGRKLCLDASGEATVTQIVNERIEECCKKKQSFIINQTSLKKKYRDEFRRIAFGASDEHPKIVYVYIEAPSVDECIRRRNETSNIDWTNIVRNMWSNFEFPTPDEYDVLKIIKQQ